MKRYLLPFLLLLSTVLPLTADEVICRADGTTILLKEDNTWEIIPGSRDILEPLREINYQGVHIAAEDVGVLRRAGTEQAGLKLRIRNNSEKTVHRIGVTIYFLDRSGQAFHEAVFLPVNDNAVMNPVILKPNYVLRYPRTGTRHVTAEGLDLAEWDVGQIRLEVTEFVAD